MPGRNVMLAMALTGDAAEAEAEARGVALAENDVVITAFGARRLAFRLPCGAAVWQPVKPGSRIPDDDDDDDGSGPPGPAASAIQ